MRPHIHDAQDHLKYALEAGTPEDVRVELEAALSLVASALLALTESGSLRFALDRYPTPRKGKRSKEFQFYNYRDELSVEKEPRPLSEAESAECSECSAGEPH